jgi:hypothetical protein
MRRLVHAFVPTTSAPTPGVFTPLTSGYPQAGILDADARVGNLPNEESLMAEHEVKVNVLVDDAHPAVVQELERAGLHVTRVLLELGVVGGSVDATRLEDLRQVPGVLAVEQSRRVIGIKIA